MEAPKSAAQGSGADTPPGRPDAQLARFVEQAELRYSADNPDSFWSLEDDFRQLAEDGFAGRWINAELAQVRDNPSYMGDWRPNQLVIHRGRGWSLSLRLIEEARGYIHSNPSLSMCTPAGPASLRYSIYRLPEEYNNAVFDPALQLEPAGSGMTAPGGVLLQSERFVYDFHATRPVTALVFATAPFQAMEWLFNRDSLHAWQANDSELACTQLRVAAYVLGRLAHQSSTEPLRELAAHPHHAVRWAAIQSLGRLSRRAALPLLEQAVNDAHPHVRRAAAKILQQIAPKK